MPNLTKAPERAIDAISFVDSFVMQVEDKRRDSDATADEVPDFVIRQVRRGKLPLLIRQAGLGDLPDVLELIDEAKLWLPSKGTDQWSMDWTDEEGRKRSDRAQASLEQKTTWLVSVTYRDRSYTVATLTIEPKANPKVWTKSSDLEVSAVYLSRLIVARAFAGLKIGAALLNWACDYAQQVYQADMLRIDVWTRNFALHRYYRKNGFHGVGKCSDDTYPSCALFQRPTRKKMRWVPAIEGWLGQSSLP